MEVFRLVFSKAIEILNYRVAFSSFSFSFGSYLFAIGALGICIAFLAKLLDWR